jgi:hypothetical protein
VLDLFGHEFGYTHRYVLDEMTGAEVYALLDAIAARYEGQAEAMRASSSQPTQSANPFAPQPGGETVAFPENAPPEILRMLGVHVD